MLHEAAAERGIPPVGGEVAGCVYDDGVGAHDPHGCILEEDLGNPEAAVAEQEPRVAAPGVTGEVEPRPIAVGAPKAKGKWHDHVAATGLTTGLPYRWPWQRARQLLQPRAATPPASLPPLQSIVAQLQRLMAPSWMMCMFQLASQLALQYSRLAAATGYTL